MLEDYNETHREMKLVLFDEAIDHLVRIMRIVGLSRGHAFLIGIDGSGRQSLTRLAAFLSGATFFEIKLRRAYRFAASPVFFFFPNFLWTGHVAAAAKPGRLFCPFCGTEFHDCGVISVFAP